MIFGKQNRQRSSSRTSNKRRKKNVRSIRLEKLQSRDMMAADVGVIEPADLYEAEPAEEPVAAEVRTLRQIRRRMRLRSSLRVSTEGLGVDFKLSRFGQLSVTGTEFKDVVDMNYNAETGKIDIFAETFNSIGQVIGRVQGSVKHDDVVAVNADMRGGDDILNAKVFYIPVNAQGGTGNDQLSGSYGKNTFDGGSGNDVLKGSVANDTLRGGSGRDTIDGHAGDDVIYGGTENDTLIGGYGDDDIYGEDGRDTIWGDPKFTDNENGGDDDIWGGADRDTIRGGGGNDEIWGEGGDDWIWGGLGQDVLSGGDDPDFISGGDDRDIISGEGGNDRLQGDDGNDLLIGGSGNDWMYGFDGYDTLYGDSGTDYLFGGANNDYLDGGRDWEKDHVYGEAGNDTFVRHKGFLSDDPDVFEDRLSYETIVDKWFWDI